MPPAPDSLAAKLAGLQADLVKISGITSARVIGDDRPREIHIVASGDRAPKQLVRDIQSLAAAAYGLPIDHRIVSVVRLESDLPTRDPKVTVPDVEALDVGPSISPELDQRPVLDRVVFASKGDTGWVKVGLMWPDGEATEGAAPAGATRDSRANSAITALQRALDPVMTKREMNLYVDHVLIQPIGTTDAVLVRASLHSAGGVTPLVGSALIYDDVATASVRALLQAVNRQLR